MNKVQVLIIALVILGVGLVARSQPADAAFHIMRVWEVMGGAYGNPDVQYVELRMPSGGQNFIAGHQMCFFDASGTAKALMSFTASAPFGPAGASIMMGSSEFDAAWAAGSPDYTFGGAGSTMTSLNGGDVNHPIQAPGGKVGFGDYDASCVPSGGFGVIDSVAYGASGAVTADFGTKLGSDLPLTGTQTIKLTGAFCHPFQGPACPRSNIVDYSLLDANTPAGTNNVPQSGPVGAIVKTGIDYYETPNPTTAQSFLANPIPGGFFDPGSEPFDGVAQLRGAPIGPAATLGTTDTVVRRLDRMEFPTPLPAMDVIPIEMIQLNLVSTNPITVTYTGGIPAPETWNVSVSVAPAPQSTGMMSITQTNAAGGTFDSMLTVFPHFTFTRISDSATRTLDYLPNQYQSFGSPWRFTCPAGVLIGPSSSNFCASVNDTMRVQTQLMAPNAQQSLLPACGDPDADGVTDCVPDNCPSAANPGQENNDGDSMGDACDPDDDNDTVLDVSDNCQFVANLGQGNFDADALGDVCDPDDDNDGNPDATDPDDDNDGVTDLAEGPCGGATPSNLRPERTDPPFAGIDDDGDTAIDEALPGGTSTFDCDGDGYIGTAEDHVFAPAPAGDQDACGINGWAADLSPVIAPNRINVGDLSSYIAPVRYLNTNVGDHAGDIRWDVVPGSAFGAQINIQDMTNISIVAPPMLGGVRAFNGPSCPWPP